MEHQAASYWLMGLAIWCGLFTINALRPSYRPALFSAVSFFSGWLTQELVWHHLLIQLGLVGLLVGLGGAQSWPGWVGLGLFGLSWVGLLMCGAQSMRARRTATEALADLPEATPAGPGQRPNRIPLSRWLVPWPFRPRLVEKIRNIPYREIGGRTLRLDVYRHQDQPQGCPILLWFHGGGWVVGDKREQGLLLMHHLAARGWVCFTATYRKAPRGRLPDMVADSRHALAWIKAHAHTYGGDAGFVVTSGGSAGAQLASLLALSGQRSESSPEFKGVDLRVQACVAMYGVYDLLDPDRLANPGLRGLLENTVIGRKREETAQLYRDLSPISQISPEAPPFLLVHGARDTLAPIAGARSFAKVFAEKSNSTIHFVEFPGAQHAFDIFPSQHALAAVEAASRFCQHQYQRSLPPTTPGPPDASIPHSRSGNGTRGRS